MSTKPAPKILEYCARRILEYYPRLARAPTSGMKPGAIYLSGINPDDPKQVGLAKKLVQDLLDLNIRREHSFFINFQSP